LFFYVSTGGWIVTVLADANGRRGPVSVKDVAATAGVSIGTVSNVLNHPERVSAATRLRVEDAISLLGFIRNDSARQLRSGTSRVLAYVMLDATNPFFTDVAQGVEDAASAAGLAVFLCNSSQHADRERALWGFRTQPSVLTWSFRRLARIR
jgi:LacI family transcriptional regulator